MGKTEQSGRTGLILRTLGLVWRISRLWTFVLGLLTLASAALPVMVAWAGKGIVDGVVAGSREATLRWVIVELCVVAAHAIAQRSLGLVRQLLGSYLALDINVRILDKAISLELKHFEDGKFYDALTKARREASFRPLSVVTEGFQLVQNALTLAGYIALVVRYSPWAALVLLATALPAAAVEMWFSRSAFRLRNWRSPESRQLNYLEYVLANDGHVKEVKLFGLGKLFLGRYRSLGEKFYKEDRRLEVKRSFWALLLSLIGTVAFYGCYVMMALAAAAGRITLGNMTLYLVALRQGQQSFQSILSAVGGIYEHTLYMSNLFEYLAIPESPRSALEPAAPPKSERGVRFEDVGFRYPIPEGSNGEEKWALRGINVFIPAGQSVALVGQNGAGKTTLIKLLTRLYEATEGRVLIDGKDVRAWDPEALRARLAVIFQDFNEYQLDVRDNVGLGSATHLGETERIERATDRGGAKEVIAGLPSGLATRLGRWAHDGVELSGGQWQKIALSRAFMREEADILVLDEPTAALDAEAEHAVFERFRTLSSGRTTFLISHRFSTVRMADRILVIEGGHIVEDGSHDTLLKANARYAHLFNLQARGYL
jgi:ATP-binding cassette subfamily B protein